MKFTIVTNHESLCHLKIVPILTSHLARWLDTIEEFNIKVVYKLGKENMVIDMLSR